MDKINIAKHHQIDSTNIMMEIATLASKTPHLIDLSLGDPDIITHPDIIQAAFNDVSSGHTKYTASEGSQEFIQSIITFYKKHYNLSFNPSEIRATVGGLHGMYLTLMTLLNPRDEVIIHEPFFTPYEDQVKLNGGIPVFVPTYEDDGFQLNMNHLKQAITPKTKAIIINSPNNPTGAVFSNDTFNEIANLAKEHGFYILSDEVYENFVYNNEFKPMTSFAPENTITFGSFSKTFAMTGWRIGYMIGPDYIIDAAKRINESITYSAPTPSQRAGIYAINHFEEIAPDNKQLFHSRLFYIKERVDRIPSLSLPPVKGSIYAFVNISKTGMTSVPFVEKILKETSVLMIPGKAFGNSGDNYVRIAATQDISILKEAFDRIEGALS